MRHEDMKLTNFDPDEMKLNAHLLTASLDFFNDGLAAFATIAREQMEKARQEERIFAARHRLMWIGLRFYRRIEEEEVLAFLDWLSGAITVQDLRKASARRREFFCDVLDSIDQLEKDLLDADAAK